MINDDMFEQIGGTIVSYEILLMQMKDFSHYEVSGGISTK